MSIMWLTDLQALPLLEGTNHTRNVKLNATMGIQASQESVQHSKSRTTNDRDRITRGYGVICGFKARC